MGRYSISETARKLEISKDKLRYYDKIFLLNPKRGENNYRYYDDEDILKYKYIEVMKKAGISFEEIKIILNNKWNCKKENDDINLNATINIIDRKMEEVFFKVNLLKNNLEILKRTKELLIMKKKDEDAVKDINNLVLNQFNEIRGRVNENIIL